MFDENFEKKFMQQRDNGMWLSDEQVEILEKYGINYQECREINELLYRIDNMLMDEDIEELDRVANELAERNYYQNTNK